MLTSSIPNPYNSEIFDYCGIWQYCYKKNLVNRDLDEFVELEDGETYNKWRFKGFTNIKEYKD